MPGTELRERVVNKTRFLPSQNLHSNRRDKQYKNKSVANHVVKPMKLRAKKLS